MSSFELYLLSVGYVKYVYLVKKRRYERTNAHIISTMVNIDHRYFKEGVDPNTDRSQEIVFGLHEQDRPPTLIFPRPKGIVTDDQMNVMLQIVPFEDILNMISI